jgi:hypothetical protein
MVAAGVAGDRLRRIVGGMTFRDFATFRAARLFEIQHALICITPRIQTEPGLML